VRVAGRRVDVQIREALPNKSEKRRLKPGAAMWPRGRGLPAGARRHVEPRRTGELGTPESLGPSPRVQTPVDWGRAGTAVHAFWR